MFNPQTIGPITHLRNLGSLQKGLPGHQNHIWQPENAAVLQRDGPRIIVGME